MCGRHGSYLFFFEVEDEDDSDSGNFYNMCLSLPAFVANFSG